ncbi:MAG: hypothetical protein GY757_29825, partial [bacterium]|nr:hypothetical protein [bacterium]
METIIFKNSAHLKTFKKIHSVSELKQLNLHHPGKLKALGLNKKNALKKREELKAYQRLLRVGVGIETIPGLLAVKAKPAQKQKQIPTLDSAYAIASLPEDRFVEIIEALDTGQKAAAKEIYQNSQQVKAKSIQVWANLKSHFAAPMPRMLQNTCNAGELENLPGYDELFGSLDYLEVHHDHSIFGPSAYLLDLLRVADEYIIYKNPEDKDCLHKRRPDIGELDLTIENTNRMDPFIQHINKILLSTLGKGQPIDQTLQSFTGQVHPFEFPFYLPLEILRAYLKESKTSLAEFYSLLNTQTKKENQTDDLSNLIALETLELSLEEWQVISESKTEKADLVKAFGLSENPPEEQTFEYLLDYNVFLKQTGLDWKKLEALFNQGVEPGNLDEDAPGFYINQDLEDNYWRVTEETVGTGEAQTVIKSIRIGKSETDLDLENELYKTGADRLHRFIRLANRLQWSFTDLDWVMKTLSEPKLLQDAELLQNLARVKYLHDELELPLDVVCSLFSRMKTIGKDNLFDRVYPDLKDVLDDTGETLWTPDDDEENYTGKIASGLKINALDLLVLAEILEIDREVHDPNEEGKEEDEAPILTYILNLDTLSRLHRAVVLIKQFHLSIDHLFRMMALLEFNKEQILKIGLEPGQVVDIAKLCQWMDLADISFDELIFIVDPENAESFFADQWENEVRDFFNAFWTQSPHLLLTPKDLFEVARQIEITPVISLKTRIKKKIRGPEEEQEPDKEILLFESLCESGNFVDVTDQYAQFNTRPGAPESGKTHEVTEENIAIVISTDLTEFEKIVKEKDISKIPGFELETILQRQFEKQEAYIIEQLSAFFQYTPENFESAYLLAEHAENNRLSAIMQAKKENEPNEDGDLPEPDDPRHLHDKLLTPLVYQETEENPEAKNILIFMSQVSRWRLFAVKLELDLREANSLVDYHDRLYEIDCLNELGLEDMQRLWYWQQISAGDEEDHKLLRRIEEGLEDEAGEEEPHALVRAFGAQCGLSLDSGSVRSIGKLLSADDYNISDIINMYRFITLGDQVGCDFTFFRDILELAQIDGKLLNPGDTPESNEEPYKWKHTKMLAEAAKTQVLSRSDTGKWPEKEKEVEGALQEKLRDSMCATLMLQHDLKNKRQISEYLLIDVEMSSIADISPIKEAMLAVQTYLNRCRMGLEKDVTVNIPEVWWEWLMAYRVWEANRKVFLYPENYIEPSLRTDKTPFFEELEGELMQQNITREAAETVYHSYFEKFSEISNLKHMCCYQCDITEPGAVDPVDTLFVFGRSKATPWSWHFQACKNPNHHKPGWQPWRKIDAAINADCITPVYCFDKLIVFWVEHLELEKGKDDEGEAIIEHQFTVNFSFQKPNGTWSTPQALLDNKVIKLTDGNKGEPIEEVVIDEHWLRVGALAIRNSIQPEQLIVNFGPLGENEPQIQTAKYTFVIDGDLEMDVMSFSYREYGQIGNLGLELSQAKDSLAGAAVGDYALFAGGHMSGDDEDTINVFVVGDDGPKLHEHNLKLSENRWDLAGAAVGNYVLFAGGSNDDDYSNLIDVFVLGDAGPEQYTHELTLSEAR